MSYLANPYDADRSIHGRSGRVFVDGLREGPDWLAQAEGITWSVEISRDEVNRSGAMWTDYKEGGRAGSGSLEISKVNSDFEHFLISYLNGVDPSTGDNLSHNRLPSLTIAVNLEDRGIPGIEVDANGEATAGHESILLHKAKIWTLEGGFSTGELINRSYEFTFSGISMPERIIDPV